MSCALCCDEILDDEVAVADVELVDDPPHAANTPVAAAASITPAMIRTGLFRNDIDIRKPFKK